MNKSQLRSAFVLAFEAAEFAAQTWNPKAAEFTSAVREVSVSTEVGVQPLMAEIEYHVERQTKVAQTLSEAHKFGVANKAIIEDWKRANNWKSPVY